jgi:ABC-type dipeptide transport system, periplasmic component
VLESYSRESGTGAFNRTRYSNPTLDRLLREAAASFDPARRNQLLQQAARAGFGDYGIVPLYFPVDYWAARKGVIFHPNKSERTSLLFIETQP